MKTKILILALMLMMAFTLSACTLNPSVEYSAGHKADMDIYYVDAGEMRVKTLNISAGFQSAVGEWLKANGLDDDYKIVGGRINNKHSETIELSEYKFVYADVYEFYFDADLADYLRKEENNIIYESLMLTLDAANEVISGIVDEWIDNNATD